MGMRFTVGKKIGLGFGIVLVLLLTVFVLTLYVVWDAEDTLKKSIDTNDKFLNVDQPSVFQLNKLKEDFFERKDRQPNMDELRQMHVSCYALSKTG